MVIGWGRCWLFMVNVSLICVKFDFWLLTLEEGRVGYVTTKREVIFKADCGVEKLRYGASYYRSRQSQFSDTCTPLIVVENKNALSFETVVTLNETTIYRVFLYLRSEFFVWSHTLSAVVGLH